MQNVLYASAVGSIMYDVICTRPDVAVSCYTDAGYLTDADDLKSQNGYVFILNGGAVDWKSAKQSIFATSSAEVEYIAAFDASKKAVWVRKFISGLGVVPTIEKPISMYCDNTRAIAIANESGITKGSIMYAVRCIRPDVAFAQNVTSQFQQNPSDLHWTTVKNILKYLKNTKDMFLVYERYVFVLNSGVVDWKSAKQSIFATSSAEAEYIAAFDASKEAIWVRKFIFGQALFPQLKNP
nr:retrovirus-related Pol polyprotein from transposon TNT 1-94 [Tanacetum cinerariifolium]